MNPRTPTAKGLAAALLALAAGAAGATEYGSVVSSTPVMGEVSVPQRQCYDEEQAAPAPRTSSGAGAILGAVVGGVVGNSVGAGMGRAAATGIGAVAGAAIGDQIESNTQPPAAYATTTVRRCRNVSQREQRIVGYDVVYDYAGRRYSTRLAQDPGERIPLDVRVTPAGAAVPPARVSRYDDEAAPAPVYAAPPAYVAAPPAYYAPPPAYYAPPVVWGGPSIYVAPTLWFGGSFGGGGHHRHWH